MEIGLLVNIGMLNLALILVPFFFHVRSYSKLLRSIKARGLDVDNLEAECFDFGARGFFGKLKKIESEYLHKGELSKEEERLLYSSKRSYYAMAPFLIGFMVALTLVLVKAKWG
jgi:hypothetical protein